MQAEPVTVELFGRYRDVVRSATGTVLYDSGVRSNAIVGDCRRLLAGFMHGGPPAGGIAGIRLGMGDPSWDLPGGLPAPNPSATALFDTNSHLVPAAALTLDFLAGGVIVGAPTNVLQIAGTFGPGVPPWPDAAHPSITLREFALVADLGGTEVLVNYVTHTAIVKDPTSSLERTVWLTF